MTAPARISQADMERAVKAVRAGGYERARIIMDLAQAKIEVIIGESPEEETDGLNPLDRILDDAA